MRRDPAKMQTLARVNLLMLNELRVPSDCKKKYFFSAPCVGWRVCLEGGHVVYKCQSILFPDSCYSYSKEKLERESPSNR